MILSYLLCSYFVYGSGKGIRDSAQYILHTCTLSGHLSEHVQVQDLHKLALSLNLFFFFRIKVYLQRGQERQTQ